MTSFSGFFPGHLACVLNAAVLHIASPFSHKSLSSSFPLLGHPPFVPSHVPGMSQLNNEGIMHLEKEV